jgi:ABC-2 type transport system permease protein
MKAIIIREISSFFGSPIGYLVIAVFLILNGLFLWVFDGDFNILNGGFADLNPFFTISPWILIFLIPAVTMRSFSDETKQGTIELLLTKPISIWQIVFGKFLAAFSLVIIALLPTLIYVKVIYGLGIPVGNLDFGTTIGSYFGLLFLAASYTAIGIFTSSLSDNQIVSFISAVFICFLFYFGFEGLAQYSWFGTYDQLVSAIGMDSHFKSMSRGVLDTRDIIYFVSIAVVFLNFTVFKIKSLQW